MSKEQDTYYDLSEKYCDLANGIIEQAVNDYRKALRMKKKNSNYTPKDRYMSIENLESFFKSKWFSALTKIDGIWLMNKIKEEINNEDG